MIAIELKGKRACFARPEYKEVRRSYDFITPSAARGILESIYWHPGIRYVIDEIRVLNPIHMCKSELQRQDVLEAGWLTEQAPVVKEAEILTDVHYLILAHFIITARADPTCRNGKVISILKRRMLRHKAFREPNLGMQGFTAEYDWVRLSEVDEPRFKGINLTQDFGLMLYDADYEGRKKTPVWFRAVMKKGVVDLRNLKVIHNGIDTVVNVREPKA